MAKLDTLTQYNVFLQMKARFGTEMTDAQLELIDNIYLTERKSASFKNAFFGGCNFVLALIFLIAFWLMKPDDGCLVVQQNIFIILMSLFGLFHAFVFWKNFMEYRKINMIHSKESADE